MAYTQTSEEKVKPFRLVKYFTFTSLILMLVGAIVLTILNTHWAKSMLLKKSEDYAHLLIENLNHQIFLQFIIPVTLKYGKIQLREEEQFERMDKIVRSTLHSFKVEMVHIHDINSTISYSFDKEMIGRKTVGGTGYQNAILGKSTSKLVQRGNFWEILFGFPKEMKIITFAPLKAEKPLARISGPVLGVVEITQDLSEDHKKISKLQIPVIQTCFVVMGILFLVLRLVVKRGEGIIQRRVLERIRLEEQLNRAKHLANLGEMTAGISHEIRNPLGIIKSSAELLRKKMDRIAPSNTIPQIIIEETGRLNNIITDFLNFAKPKTPSFAPCCIIDVIKKNLAFLASQIEEQNYVIHQHYANNLPELKADFDMLYQAFLNILINSMQAMPKGGEIYIEAGLRDNYIFILFEDEGDGITQDSMDKIWNPFFTTKEKGTGLGLGIVKNIIESHEGNILAENRLERGVRITIELPVT